MERPSDDFYTRHPRMDLSLRAKIFIPFEPLRGFRAALTERERRAATMPREDLSQERRERLSATIRQLAPGDMVLVRHYARDRYEWMRGLVTKVSEADACLWVAGTRMAFGDIAELERLEGSAS